MYFSLRQKRKNLKLENFFFWFKLCKLFYSFKRKKKMKESLNKQKRKIRQALTKNKILFSRLIKEIEISNIYQIIPSSKTKKSAVLLLIFPDENEKLHTIIIEKINDNTPHSGQIALPGGQKEWYDLTLHRTAIREASEELGIKNRIETLGRLSPIYISVSNFFVQPFVGWLKKKPNIKLNTKEIKNYYFIPLDYIKNLEKYITEKDIIVRGELLKVKGFEFSKIFIWGATAKILAEFSEYLNLID